jgi:hypothetical protein
MTSLFFFSKAGISKPSVGFTLVAETGFGLDGISLAEEATSLSEGKSLNAGSSPNADKSPCVAKYATTNINTNAQNLLDLFVFFFLLFIFILFAFRLQRYYF